MNLDIDSRTDSYHRHEGASDTENHCHGPDGSRHQNRVGSPNGSEPADHVRRQHDEDYRRYELLVCHINVSSGGTTKAIQPWSKWKHSRTAPI